MRCGIDTSNIYVNHYTTHQAVITCGEHLLRCGIDTSNTYFTLQSIHYSTIDSPKQPRIRATTQHPQGLGSPPNSLVRLRETPYTTLLVYG